MQADLLVLVGWVVVTLPGCSETVPPQGPVAPSAPVLRSIAVLPDHVTLLPGGSQLFEVTGTWDNGATGPVGASFSAPDGGVATNGLYTAGDSAGTFRVIATAMGSPLADTAVVTVSLNPPPPGPYQAAFAKDWNTFADKAALADANLIGVDARFNELLQPVLPATDFYDLVPDPVFGKVVRYLGGPRLNPYPIVVEALAGGVAGNAIWISLSSGTLTVKNDSTNPTITETFSGLTRANWLTALNLGGLAPVGQANGQPSALIRAVGPVNTGYTALPNWKSGGTLTGGAPGVNARRQFVDNTQGRVASGGEGFGSKPLGHLWIRQFVRFSPNFTTESFVGGQNAPSEKMMFLRLVSGGTTMWVLDGPRSMWFSSGAPSAPVEKGQLAITNVTALDPNNGYDFPDAYPMLKVRCATLGGAPCGDGNGEWYEMVIHHKTVAERGEFTLYWRQYTVSGVVNPQPWKINGHYKVLAPGSTWPAVQRYVMGINRNRQWDEDMYLDWGPYEIVDGTRYPNPWGMPGGD
jgi:hypothetical protein